MIAVSYLGLQARSVQESKRTRFLCRLRDCLTQYLCYRPLCVTLLCFFPDNLKENDKELRAMLKRVWPKLTKKTLDRVVPKPPSLINNGKCTRKKLYFVIKIYNMQSVETPL